MTATTDVITCCSKVRSATFRLLRATRRKRRLGAKPKPWSSGCWKSTVIAEVTAGLSRFPWEVEEERLVFKLTLKADPVGNAC